MCTMCWNIIISIQAKDASDTFYLSILKLIIFLYLLELRLFFICLLLIYIYICMYIATK